jgi:hypothetical protein
MSGSLRKKLGNLSDKEKNIIVYLIGQIGRDASFSKERLTGKRMLDDCHRLIESARNIVGGRLILLECKPIDRLCEFYSK